MWGIFEVFFDTMIVCTMTALIALTSGMINLETGVVNVKGEFDFIPLSELEEEING